MKDYDRGIILATLALCLFGVIMVFSASSIYALKAYGTKYYFVERQLVYLVLGLLAGSFAAAINIDLLRKYSNILYGFIIVLLVLVFVPHIGVVVSGSHRWLRLGAFTLQPSEFAKPVLIILIAHVLEEKGQRLNNAPPVLLPLIYTAIVLVLILREPDFGSAVIITTVVFSILFLTGASVASLALVIIPVVPVAVLLVMHSTYRLNRVKAFLDPWQHAQTGGFQIVQSTLAYGAGGITGVGIGNSFEKLFYLPEAHTDFIFSVIAEELGFIGVAAVIGVFIFLITRAFSIAARSESTFTKATVYGLTLFIALQVIINIAVTLGLLPTKGLTMPFISYGGSSLTAELISVGILLNLSRRVNDGSDEADNSRWG
ncbi:MAG: putative lipid II flippase FtsW [Deltaproteobacteria bacterium]|nr:putative lipid II flippase FtsW [Deltaproteobacteria bacterium]